MFTTRHVQSDPALADRLDPGFWHPAYETLLARCRLTLRPLGDFIVDITYGPIVTGKVPPRIADGVPVIHQGQVSTTGVDLRQAVRVPEGSDWDCRPRARVQRGDLLLPRSGVASVAKNRVCIYYGDAPAVVGSFVNRIAVRGVDPVYALICLKSRVVWAQMHRLINGVGTPNISFEEVRSLLIPWAPAPEQRDLCARYAKTVHTQHMRWLCGEQAAQARGIAAFREIAEHLDALCFPDEN